MHNAIQRRLNNNVYSRIFGGHRSFSFWAGVTLMMHRVKAKIPLQSKHDYRLKEKMLLNTLLQSGFKPES
jgi:hypothetical protein